MGIINICRAFSRDGLIVLAAACPLRVRNRETRKLLREVIGLARITQLSVVEPRPELRALVSRP